MTNVRFFKDVNGCKKPGKFNGAAIFTDRPLKKGKKRGWDGITAVRDGAGDGPYELVQVSENYLADCGTEITEAEARELLPKLVATVEEEVAEWASCT